jgi:hypothetical protein
MFSLSRLYVTGTLNTCTPRVVFLEILEAHSIKNILLINEPEPPHNIESIIQDILTVRVPQVPALTDSDGTVSLDFDRFSDLDLALLAHFVNRNVDWNYGSLITAADHLLFNSSIEQNFVVGPQNPSCPTSYNACLLYKHCRELGIPTRYSSTSEEMSLLIRFYLHSRQNITSLLSEDRILSLRLTHPDIITSIRNVFPQGSNEASDSTETDREIESSQSETIAVHSTLSDQPPNFNTESQHTEPNPIQIPVTTTSIQHPETTTTSTSIMNSKPITPSTNGSSPVVKRRFNIGDHYEELVRLAKSYNESKMVSMDNLKVLTLSCRDRMFGPRPNIVEAIVIAGVLYRIDVTGADDPLEEVSEILTVGHKRYLAEKKLIQGGNNHEGWREISLTKRFNQMLPKEFYDSKMLKSLLIEEGYTEDEVAASRDPYGTLQTIVMSNTFYHGKQANMKNSTTVIDLDEVEHLNNHEIVCYGVRDEQMLVYKYSELLICFRINMNFAIPDKGQAVQFSDISIRKLAKLCEKDKYEGETMENFREREKLRRVIESVKISMSNISERSRRFMEKYASMSEIHQIEVQDLLENVHLISMMMRGWSREDGNKYPITEAPVENQLKVERNVNQEIWNFLQKCESLGPISESVLSLPLLRYRDGRYVASNDSLDGTTVRDRLNIVREGKTVQGCIRMSSNWLAATSHYHMTLIGMKTSYKIEHLRDIA